MKLTRRTKLIAGGLVLAVTAIAGGTACTTAGVPSGQASENAQQAADTGSLENNQPLPHFNYSQERQNLIDIETAQANNVQTTSFFINYGVADPIGSCPSIGFGIPDSASLSNPWQVQDTGNYNGVPIGQMDPTGIYAPTSSQGTFVICLTDSGTPYIDRIESTVDTAGGPASWDYGKHMYRLTGAPTAPAYVAPKPGSTAGTAPKSHALGR